MQNKNTEATLKENTVKVASNIQIVEPALAPQQPASTHARLILFAALLGSAGLGVLVALLLDYISKQRGMRILKPAPAPIDIHDTRL